MAATAPLPPLGHSSLPATSDATRARPWYASPPSFPFELWAAKLTRLGSESSSDPFDPFQPDPTQRRLHGSDLPPSLRLSSRPLAGPTPHLFSLSATSPFRPDPDPTRFFLCRPVSTGSDPFQPDLTIPALSDSASASSDPPPRLSHLSRLILLPF